MPLPLLIPVVIGGLGAATYGAKKIYNKVKEKGEAERKQEELLFNQDENNFKIDKNYLRIFNLRLCQRDDCYVFTTKDARVDYFGVANLYPCASIIYKNPNSNDIEIIIGVYFKEHGYRRALCYCAACRSSIDIKSNQMKNNIWFEFYKLTRMLVSQEEDAYKEGNNYSEWINEIDRYMSIFSQPQIFTHGNGKQKDRKNFINFLEGDKSYREYENKCMLQILKYYKEECDVDIPTPRYYDEMIMW